MIMLFSSLTHPAIIPVLIIEPLISFIKQAL